MFRIAVFFFALITLPSLADEQGHAVTITPILGVGFAEMVEIEGRIIGDSDADLPAHFGTKFIKVTRVGDTDLKQAVLIELIVFGWTDIEIPDRHTEVRLRGYETGRFTGIPAEAFGDIPEVATAGHHFRSQFLVTKLLD